MSELTQQAFNARARAILSRDINLKNYRRARATWVDYRRGTAYTKAARLMDLNDALIYRDRVNLLNWILGGS